MGFCCGVLSVVGLVVKGVLGVEIRGDEIRGVLGHVGRS